VARLYIDGILQVGVEVMRPPEGDHLGLEERVIPMVWDESVGYRAVIVDRDKDGSISMWSPVIYYKGMYPETRVSCVRTFHRYRNEIRLAEMLLN